MKPPSIYDLTITLHLLGMAISLGAAIATDTVFFRTIKQKIFTKELITVIGLLSQLVWLGATLVIGSGLVLFFQATEYYLANPQFWAKMIVITVVMTNGIIFHFYHWPLLKKLINKPTSTITQYNFRREFLLISGVLSSVSWMSALFLGATLTNSWPLMVLLSGYTLVITIGIITVLALRNYLIPPTKKA